ncbi:uncharacterized protein ACR2FA_005324 [Aphomia sociella]
MAPKTKFQEKVVLKLIKEIRERPSLWKTTDEDYSDRLQTATAWKEIKEILNMPEDLLKIKWKNLRDTFRRELRKFKTETLANYRGKWNYFKYMWFIHSPTDVMTEIPNDLEEDDADSDDCYNVKLEPIETEYIDESEHEELVPTPAKKRRLSEENEYDLMFLKSLAPYFKELDPIRKLVLRSKMQDMILNELAAQASQNKNS